MVLTLPPKDMRIFISRFTFLNFTQLMETSTGFEHLHHTSFGIGEVGGVKYF
jgi:hypothetical protein